MSKLKKVAIVGRMNVGKSTLFNRLSTNVKSITLDFEGVTRDFIKDVVSWNGVDFELVDTGGLDVKKTQDVLSESVKEVAKNVIEESDLVLLVVDGSVGVMPQEQEVARYLRKLNKPVFVLVNKSDKKVVEENMPEFYKLGFNKVIAISAQHGLGIGDVLSEVVEELAKTTTSFKEEEDVEFKVALLGKPNVGKSSLMNALLNKTRSIVADLPGTTREPIHENIKFYQENIQLIDTAGVRKKKSVNEKVEELMVKSTFEAVRDADIVMLLLDSNEGRISDQELKLAFYVFEQGKALIILFNKLDLIEDNDEKKVGIESSKEDYNFLFNKVETLNISCKTGKNIGKILPLIDKVWSRYNYQFDDYDMTGIFKEQLAKSPLYKSEQELVLTKAKQVTKAPINIVLYVNLPMFFEQSQLSFFENVLRSKYDLKGVPLKFMARKK